MQERQHRYAEQDDTDEIDLLELFNLFRRSKRLIVRLVLMCGFLGLIMALTSRNEYVAFSKLYPESSASGGMNLGGLGGLAGLAGINLDAGQASGISPELYPEIVKSQPFLMEAALDTLYFKHRDQHLSSFYFLKEVLSPNLGELAMKYTFGLPGIVIEALKDKEENTSEATSSEIWQPTKEDKKVLDAFAERVSLDLDIKTGVIVLSIEMPDPYAAAALAQLVTDLLTDRVIEYKVEKARINLKFVQERLEETKLEYENSLAELARYTDSHLNIVSSVAQIETQRLQNEVDVTFSVFKELAAQVEQAKIKIKEQTPVFTVLDPPSVPTEKSKPKRLVMIIVSMLIGFFIATTIIVTRHILKL